MHPCVSPTPTNQIPPHSVSSDTSMPPSTDIKLKYRKDRIK